MIYQPHRAEPRRDLGRKSHARLHVTLLPYLHHQCNADAQNKMLPVCNIAISEYRNTGILMTARNCFVRNVSRLSGLAGLYSLGVGRWVFWDPADSHHTPYILRRMIHVLILLSSYPMTQLKLYSMADKTYVDEDIYPVRYIP